MKRSEITGGANSEGDLGRVWLFLALTRHILLPCTHILRAFNRIQVIDRRVWKAKSLPSWKLIAFPVSLFVYYDICDMTCDTWRTWPNPRWLWLLGSSLPSEKRRKRYWEQWILKRRVWLVKRSFPRGALNLTKSTPWYPNHLGKSTSRKNITKCEKKLYMQWFSRSCKLRASTD